MMTDGEIDIEEWEEVRDRMKEEYYQETGEELPDHVIKNLRLVNASGPTLEDLRDAREQGKERAEKNYTGTQMAISIVATALIAGAVAFASGLGLASNFGLAVVAIVTALFGFVVGAIANA